jgi:hypothetical protein
MVGSTLAMVSLAVAVAAALGSGAVLGILVAESIDAHNHYYSSLGNSPAATLERNLGGSSWGDGGAIPLALFLAVVVAAAASLGSGGGRIGASFAFPVLGSYALIRLTDTRVDSFVLSYSFSGILLHLALTALAIATPAALCYFLLRVCRYLLLNLTYRY